MTGEACLAPTLAPQTRTLNSYAPWHDVNEISNENALMAYLTPKTCRTYSFPPIDAILVTLA